MATKNVQCPSCHVQLVQRELGQVSVDECPECGGIWFEKGELDLAKDSVDEDLNWLDFKVWKSGELTADLTSSHCPSCGKRTMVLTCGETGVSVDYCDACQGSWLEKGEFEKLIAALEEEVNDLSFSDYAKESLREAGDVLADPKSALSEWKGLASVIRLMGYRLFVEHPKAVEAIMSVYRAAH